MRRFIPMVSLLALVHAPAALADGQHEGDVLVARSGDNNMSWMFNPSPPIVLDPVDGPLFYGWTGTMPGFEHLFSSQPEEDRFTLESGASIHLELLQTEEGFFVWDEGLTGAGLAEPGDRLLLGGHTLHNHPIWHIDSDVVGTDFQGAMDITFRLLDTGSTAYAPSESFTLTFSTFLLPGDADFDGHVGLRDASALLSNYGRPEPMRWRDGDFTGDQMVGPADLGILIDNWAATVNGSASSTALVVPEPATAAIFMAAVTALTLRRARR